MSKDILFLLPPGFADNQRREFCPECAELWGVLAYYPAIKEALEIEYVGLDHPRQEICARLGEGRWNAPTLILDSGPLADDGLNVQSQNGVAYLDSAREIAKYFALRFGTAWPRGS
jgi:Protein of unknown function (DUF3088)